MSALSLLGGLQPVLPNFIDLNFVYLFLPSLTSFYRVYWVLLGFTGFYLFFFKVEQSFSQFDRVEPILTKCHLVLSSCNMFYLVLPGFKGFYQVRPSFTGFCQVEPSFYFQVSSFNQVPSQLILWVLRTEMTFRLIPFVLIALTRFQFMLFHLIEINFELDLPLS